MADSFSGALLSGTLTGGLRSFYDQMLLQTLRHNSVFMNHVQVKQDFNAKATNTVIFTEALDTEPNWNPRAETDYYLDGAALATRSLAVTIGIYGDVMKWSDFAEITNFLNNGDLRGMINGKLGQNMVDTLDILAMNAHLDSPFVTYMNSKTRFGGTALSNSDKFDPDITETIYTHLEERLIPGMINVADGGDPMIMGITSPRVIKDIRTSSSSLKWLDILKYQHAEMKMRHEVGAWGGTRFTKSTRLRRRNYGAITFQSTLNGATVAGQGGVQTVNGYTNAAHATAPRYVTAVAVTSFAVGQYVTVHSATVYDDDGASGKAVSAADGTQETRLIVNIDVPNKRIYFDKPLLKPHASGDMITLAVDLNYTIFLGGPAVVFGVGEAPTIVIPPKIDSLQMINQVGWRMFGKLQMFRPEWCEVVVSGGSVD